MRIQTSFGGKRHLPAAFAALLLGGALWTADAAPARNAAPLAAESARIILNAPIVQIDAKTHHLDLDLVMIQSKIYNPASGRLEDVDLRGYRAKTLVMADAAPKGLLDLTKTPFIAPTIAADPGDTIKISLHNKLTAVKPDDPYDRCGQVPHNTPQCFNTTNLHTHGLWVSPNSPSDNVLLKIEPGATEEYEYKIPGDHPGGTLWYHPHSHGSTAIQVGGGVAGALIIRGTHKPTPAQTGDIDTLLKFTGVKERVLVFQQIQYACFDAAGKIKIYPRNDSDPNAPPEGTWRCDAGDVGALRSYAQLGFNPAAKAEIWSGSGRFTSINGEILPLFAGASVGAIERWRMIDGGLANTIDVEFRELAKGAPAYGKLNAKQNSAWVAKYCTGAVVHQLAIATDGLTRSKAVDRGADKATTLQPGYREDILVSFPHAGRYCVVDAGAEGVQSLTTVVEQPQLLGVVRVAGAGEIADQAAHIRKTLSDAVAKAGYEKSVADLVRADLNAADGMRLTSFVPHPSLSSESHVGHQEVAFNIAAGKFMVGENIADPSKDRPYNANEWRKLTLGAVDEWVITARAGSHPFHIHVNPFQIQAIYDTKGKDVSVTGEPDPNDPNKSDMQYADLKGAWKDTIFVKLGYRVVMRTRYERFAGRFVMHCHILDHEDQGMMENIEIVDPAHKADAPDAPAHPTHMGH